MHGQVPEPPECADVGSVPPIGVKIPIGERHQFSHSVEERVEQQVEPRHPQQVVRDLTNYSV